MNRKVLLTISALAAVMLGTTFVGTVIAVSPKKIPVTVTEEGSLYMPYVDVWFTPGEIAHISAIFTGTFALHVDDEEFDFDYVATIEGNGPAMYTSKHDPTQGVFRVKQVWTCTEGDETDMFEGVAHWTMSMPGLGQWSSRIVLQGSGIFKGQTLSLSGDDFGIGPGHDNTYYGYLLIP